MQWRRPTQLVREESPLTAWPFRGAFDNATCFVGGELWLDCGDRSEQTLLIDEGEQRDRLPNAWGTVNFISARPHARAIPRPR